MKLCRVSLLAAALMVKTVSGQSTHRNDMVATITPPVHTHWGAWKTPLSCDYGKFAEAIIINSEAPLSAGDDTAGNKIKLVCRCVLYTTLIKCSFRGLQGLSVSQCCEGVSLHLLQPIRNVSPEKLGEKYFPYRGESSHYP